MGIHDPQQRTHCLSPTDLEARVADGGLLHPEAEPLVLIDVAMSEQQGPHHRHPILGPDQLRDDHLLHDAVRHAG